MERDIRNVRYVTLLYWSVNDKDPLRHLKYNKINFDHIYFFSTSLKRENIIFSNKNTAILQFEKYQ
jgi:hypothetical protein